jgi:hypothetical protein
MNSLPISDYALLTPWLWAGGTAAISWAPGRREYCCAGCSAPRGNSRSMPPMRHVPNTA